MKINLIYAKHGGVTMELEVLTYKEKKGWSSDQFPKLDSPNTLVILFVAPEFLRNPDPIEEIFKSYPQSIIMGCSTGGEIIGAEVIDLSIVVGIIKFKSTKLDVAVSKIDKNEDSYAVGEKIAKKLTQKNLRGIFVLSDGIKVNGSELIKGLNSKLSEKIVVTGGLAGDGDRFKKTFVIANKKIAPDSVVGVGFYGDKIRIGHGSQGGWDTFGPERIITKSEGNILYELDGKPALALYKEYLGKRAKDLPASGLLFPLSIRENEQDTKNIVRTILGIDEATQSLRFAGDIPEGYLVKLMRANFDRLVTGANDAALSAGSHQKDAHLPLLAVAISCIGRRLLLGEYTEEETETTLESLPKDTKQIGFYSYGEISPYARGYCDLHNQTMTITTISEDP